MLANLKFVQGAVAKKDFLPALTHFCIENGTVRGYNGTIALCSPIPFDISCKPKAEPLVRAIANCDETVQLSMTPAGRLSVRSSKFKALIDCIEGETPHAVPSGREVPVGGVALLAALKAVQPFIGEDASRPWCNGVLLKGGSVFASNNVTLVEYWAGDTLPVVVNIPRSAIKEILRINEPPTHAQYDEHCVTFHYEGRRWLRTQLLPSDWPDLGKVLDRTANPTPMDSRIFEGLEMIKPFVDKLGRVMFRDCGMHTHANDNEGASFAIEGLQCEGVYNVEMLELLKGVATTIDMTTYPAPCMFFGENMRGAIIGMRI